MLIKISGHSLDGYAIRIGSLRVKDHQGFNFTLTTPDRVYNLSALAEDDRDQWIQAIKHVLDQPLTPQDFTSKFNRKRFSKSSLFYSIFSHLLPS